MTYNGSVLGWTAPSGGSFTAGGDLSGSSSSQQVAQISGATGNLTWSAAKASPTLSQTIAATSTSTPQSITISPQAPNASAATTTYGTAGSVIVNLPAPVSTGNEATFTVSRNGTPVCWIQPNYQVGKYGPGSTALFLGAGATSPTLITNNAGSCFVPSIYGRW